MYSPDYSKQNCRDAYNNLVSLEDALYAHPITDARCVILSRNVIYHFKDCDNVCNRIKREIQGDRKLLNMMKEKIDQLGTGSELARNLEQILRICGINYMAPNLNFGYGYGYDSDDYY